MPISSTGDDVKSILIRVLGGQRSFFAHSVLALSVKTARQASDGHAISAQRYVRELSTNSNSYVRKSHKWRVGANSNGRGRIRRWLMEE
jgi:hypothetical protein